MQKREKGDDSLANNYIADSVIGAIDTVIKGAIQDLKYDQTIEAIVTSSDKAADGVYTVKSETASFEAYSSNRYYVNDTVYVMIPQGDFNKQKFITGRKVDQVSTETTFTLKLPFDDFIGLQDLTEEFNFPEEELGYIANHGHPNAQSGLIDLISNEQRHGSILTAEEQKNDTIVQTYRQTNLIGHWVREDKAPVLTTKLAVSFDVRSLLHDYRPLYGQYGIRLLVTGWTQTTETTPSEKVTQDIYFTNKDMYGDTYAYFVETTQQKIFDISSLISLEEIEIYFWQDFDFQDEQRVLIPWEDEFRGVVPPNLFLSNFNVYLGLTTDDINDERVFLYTYDDVKYGYEPEVLTNREKLDTRTLEFAWVHHDYVEEKFILVNTPEKLANYNAKIFWYQLEYDVAPTEEEAGELYWRLAPPNWKYLPDYDNQFQILVCPSIAKSKEKYMAIVSFNGTFEKSEALTFTNIVDVDSLNEALAANKNYIFKFYRPATEAEKALHAGNEENMFAFQNQAIENEWLIEDNTIGSFFVYDENNRVLKNEDEIRYSDIEYYAILYLLTRETNDEGEEYEYYSALYGDTESGFDSQIVFPENFSMITQVPMSAQDPYFINHWESGNLYDKTICKFKINYFWDLSYRDNTLSATVTRHGNTYYINKEMLFGQSGSQGSEYTVRLQLESASNYAIIKGQSFSVGAYVYDRTGRMLTDQDDGAGKMLFVWELLGPSRVTEKQTSGADGSWTVDKGGDFNGNIISGFVRNDYPPIFRVTVTGAADYPISATKGFMMTNGNASLVQQYTVMCPNRVEYKSDGSTPIYDTSEFVIESINGDKIYPEWELIQLKNGAETNEYFTLKSTTYSEVTIPTNSGEKRRPAYTGYRLVSNIGDGTSLTLIPHYWDPAMAESCYMCLSADMTEATGDDDATAIYIRQAIPFEHNVYASSLINSWDGSLTLDEENGAVLSTMMSAGTKDSQNKFTGVIMGDWEQKGDFSLDIPGLYGFTKGEQTFGFKTDGTGFIGKASAGQIQFDGNQALIKSSDENFYLNLNPMKYSLTDLGDFSLDSFNQYSYSPYFLYAKTAKTADVWGQFSDFVNEDQQLTSWTKPFFDDSAHDYFVVDPNNGVLTTGGVIAKYGKIGNWMISDNGLYQRNDSADDSRYMYLGFPSAETNESLQALKVVYDQKYLDAYLDYLNKLNQLTVQVYPSIYELDPIHYWNYARGIKLAHDILVVTLDTYNQPNQEQTLQTILENTMESMITEDFIENYMHMHYCRNNYAIPISSHKPSPRGLMYTGNRSDVYLLLGYQNVAGKYLRTSTTNYLFPRYINYYDKYYTGTYEGRFATEEEKANGQASEEGYFIYTKDVQETRYKPIPKTSYARLTDSMLEKRTVSIGYSSMTPGTTLYPENNAPSGSFIIYTKTSSGEVTVKNYLDTITVERMKELINLWAPTYENSFNAYMYQLDQQRQAGYTWVPYEQRKELEDEYAEKKAEIDRAYATAKRNLQNADVDRYAIFAGEEEFTNPIFYVKWNGDMFARRGLIANTWVIDDHSLTYQKNSDIMYIGTEEYTQADGTKWYPNGRVYAGIDDGDPTLLEGEERKWAISASDSYSEEGTYPINFGVSLSGELYAQLGTIGGWSINKTALFSNTETVNDAGETVQSSIVLDTASNALIFNNGSTVIYGDGRIILGALGMDGSTNGSLLIGGTSLIGKTYQQLDNTYSTYSSDQTTISIQTDEVTFWGGSSYAGVNLTLPVVSLTSAQNESTIITTNILSFIDSSTMGGNAGFSMAMGYVYEDEYDISDPAGYSEGDTVPTVIDKLIFYPEQGTITSTKFQPWLGTTGKRWNLYANVVNCKDLQAEDGVINAGSLYMASELVATQTWVYNQLNDVYAKIQSASSGASSGVSRARTAASNLAKGLQNNINAILNALDEKRFIESNVYYDTDTGRVKYDYVKMSVKPMGDPSIDETSDTIPVGEATVIELTEDSSTGLRLVSPFVIPMSGLSMRGINPYLIKQCGFSVADDGTVTLTLTPYEGDPIVSDPTFNQADTKFYKTNATKEIKLESITEGVGNGVKAQAYDFFGEKKTTPTATGALKLETGTSNTYADGRVNLYTEGAVVAYASVTDAYKAGWAAAIATFSFSVDEANKKVSASVGNSTYGSKSDSATYSLSSSYSSNDSVDFGSYGDYYFYCKPVTDANGTVTSYSKRVLPYYDGKYYHVTGTSASITWT